MTAPFDARTQAIISPSGSNAGIGFAIPVDVVNRVVPELIGKGRVPTPGIGTMTANETVATRLGVEGLVILRTVAGSPAARAGLRGVDLNSGTLGDVIVGANGKPVRRLADLTDQLEGGGSITSFHSPCRGAEAPPQSTCRSSISASPIRLTLRSGGIIRAGVARAAPETAPPGRRRFRLRRGPLAGVRLPLVEAIGMPAA